MIDELLRFLEIDDQTKSCGQKLWQVLAPRADAIIAEFYRKVQHGQINSHVTDAAIERLKQRQKDHWAALFASQFGDDYANSIRRVGIRHREVNLDLAWYVGGYAVIKIEFVNVIIQSDLPIATKGHLIKTLDKYVAFDMALALSSYGATIVD